MDVAVVFALGAAAGILNALAGGGPIVVVAALATLGWPADVASLTSTVALLPGQMFTGARGRLALAGVGTPALRRALAAIGLAGGAAGALLLLVTPARLFAELLPALVLLATALYAWSSRHPPAEVDAASRPATIGPATLAGFVPLAVYGGFYGGGNSFLVLALLAGAGLAPRAAGHAKNLLILLVNAAAALVFAVSGKVAVDVAVPLAIGALGGSVVGARLIDRLRPDRLRLLVIAIGLVLGGWLAVRG